MGFIDLVGVSDENICDVKYKLKNVIIKPNSKEEHSIYVEAEYEIFARVFENKQMDIIQDMYSPSVNLNFEENKMSTMVNMRNTKDTIKVRDKVKLDDIENSKISDVQVNPVINETEITNDRIRISGNVGLNFILMNDNQDNLVASNKTVAFDFTQEVDGVNENSKVNIEVVTKFREFVQDGVDVNVKVDLEVNTNSYNLETINVIDNIQETEGGEENPYSMVIYFVKQGDTLWKIAKKYKSTVEDIARVNEIENVDKINVGRQLFIPKCSKCRAEVRE